MTMITGMFNGIRKNEALRTGAPALRFFSGAAGPRLFGFAPYKCPLEVGGGLCLY